MKRLTATEIYDMIVFAHSQRIFWATIGPDSAMTADKASRMANREAVKHTWYYFNNQEEFMKVSVIHFYYGSGDNTEEHN